MGRSKKIETTPDAAKPTPDAAADRDVAAFVEKLARTPAPAPTGGGGKGRLVFGLDATASRQPTWDRACHIQAEMFAAAAEAGGLEMQLVFYRGFGECKAGKWCAQSAPLVRQMTGVACLAGHTQIRKILTHAMRATEKRKVDALVFIGDMIEEDIDALGHRAGELGLRGVPAFMFQEGDDLPARNAFQQIAKLTGGAYCRFDAGSAGQLRDLLKAVAVFAAGGRRALIDYGKQAGLPVRLLMSQLGRG